MSDTLNGKPWEDLPTDRGLTRRNKHLLAARVDAVLALHRHTPEMQWGNVCCHCFKEWPCPTVRALNGEP